MYLSEPSMTCEIDGYAERELGLRPHVLMGRAGAALANAVRERIPLPAHVLVLAGPGNNGGDGYAAATELLSLGYGVHVIDVCGSTTENQVRMEHIAGYLVAGGIVSGCEVLEEQLAVSDAVIDAILGTGSRLPLSERVRSVCAAVNASGRPRLRISADLPTGVDGEGGGACEDAFRADLTLTFVAPKVGMYAYPAREHCGEIRITSLGLDASAPDFPAEIRDGMRKNTLVDASYVASHLPKRGANTHKGSFGRLLLFVGSDAYRGAASLASAAALRAGAGLITLYGVREVLDFALARSPELLTEEIPPFDRIDRGRMTELLGAIAEADAVLFGCGTGRSVALESLLWELMKLPGCPLILDADAINSLAIHREESLHILRHAERRIILTPHPLEFSRLSGIPLEDVLGARVTAAKRFAQEEKVTLVLKGAGTITASRSGKCYLNTTGSSALAKAGTGDVLAGTIASFAAQRIPPTTAAVLGVYLHGAAGDRAALRYSEYGVTASDLPIGIAEEIAQLPARED